MHAKEVDGERRIGQVGMEEWKDKQRDEERGENKVVWLPACACGSLTTVTHTNRNIPNKLRAFGVWKADIYSVHGTISYLQCKVGGLLNQITSNGDARGLA